MGERRGLRRGMDRHGGCIRDAGVLVNFNQADESWTISSQDASWPPAKPAGNGLHNEASRGNDASGTVSEMLTLTQQAYDHQKLV